LYRIHKQVLPPLEKSSKKIAAIYHHQLMTSKNKELAEYMFSSANRTMQTGLAKTKTDEHTRPDHRSQWHKLQSYSSFLYLPSTYASSTSLFLIFPVPCYYCHHLILCAQHHITPIISPDSKTFACPMGIASPTFLSLANA